MSAKEILQAALNELIDEHDVDPRSRAIAALKSLLHAPESLPDGDVVLTASIGAGGACKVADQHGRQVAGVKAVASFVDQSGQHVFQITL